MKVFLYFLAVLSTFFGWEPDFLKNSWALSNDSSFLEAKKKEVLKAFDPESYEAKIALFFMDHLNFYDTIRISSQDIIEHIYYASKARKTMPWGKNIPENVFLNYVLFHRIAQEPFESYRPELFRLLAPVVSHTESIKDAVLLVNKWVVERVAYSPSSSWDLGPLSLLRRGFGRCEELNILFGSALRSLSIPARQSWIPGWRHTEGNHAWLEVFTEDGKWHFLDSAYIHDTLDHPWFEPYLPEVPVVFTSALDESLCTIPYKKGGKETLCIETPRYTKVRDLVVEVKPFFMDRDKTKVTLFIFNGGRLRPVVSEKPNSNGFAFFRAAGIGDYVLEVQDASKVFMKCLKRDFSRVSLRKEDEVSREEYFGCDLSLSSGPYKGGNSFHAPEGRIKSIGKVVSLWVEGGVYEPFREILIEGGLPVLPFLAFLDTRSPRVRDSLLLLVPILDPKIFSTLTTYDGIEEHVGHLIKMRERWSLSGLSYDDDTFANYVLNPQVGKDLIVWDVVKIYRILDIPENSSFEEVRQKILGYVQAVEVVRDSILEPSMNPADVLRFKVADSKDVLRETAVAALRSWGIPSRYDEYEKVVLLFDGKGWYGVKENGFLHPLNKSTLKLRFVNSSGACLDPSVFSYGKHFSISRIHKDDRQFIRKPFFRWNREVCVYELEISPGDYELVYGWRKGDGKISLRVIRLAVNVGDEEELTLKIAD